MAILVLNCGSSSVKYQLFKIKLKDVLAQGIVSAIGSPQAAITHQQVNKQKFTQTVTVSDHAQAIDYILGKLTNTQDGILKDKKEINAIGHRVVHGGKRFSKSVMVTEETKQGIRDCIDLAPLHNPHNLEGISSCEKLLPGVLQVAVFDTAFHQTIPEYAYTYGIPYEIAETYHIRRYGFHGTSHQFVAEKAAELMHAEIEKLKIITCHIGNGCSIAAINNGRSIDTSMGFTPLEGLLMGTRCGDLDPAVPTFLMSKNNMKPDEIDRILNDKSGLLGIAGTTNDMRILISEAKAGSSRAQLAIDIFCYRIKKYIAAYCGVLNGADSIVFTAGIGENAHEIRKKCCEGLEFFGIHIDDTAHIKKTGMPISISSPHSKIKVFVIPTNEELMIAREAKLFLDNISMNKL
ncbi:MAG: acetate kinase [bacterium]